MFIDDSYEPNILLEVFLNISFSPQTWEGIILTELKMRVIDANYFMSF